MKLNQLVCAVRNATYVIVICFAASGLRVLAQEATGKSPSIAVMMEDKTWQALNTATIEAVERDTIHVESGAGTPMHITTGYDVYFVAGTLFDNSHMEIKWRATKVGRVVITGQTRGSLWTGKYTGQPLGKQLLAYRVIIATPGPSSGQSAPRIDHGSDPGSSTTASEVSTPPEEEHMEGAVSDGHSAVKVSNSVAAGLLLQKAQPIYPPKAKAACVQGAVVLNTRINKNGVVDDARAQSGDPLLTDAAVDAVKKWRYRPYLLNGRPVAVETTVTINFSLAGCR